MADPTTLVVLPTLGDRLDMLEKALLSVLSQPSEGISLKVVAPRDAAAARALATSLGATVVDDPRHGISAAVNAGVDSATTEQFLAWCGDDDLFRPEGFARLRSALLDRPDAVAAFGWCDYIDDRDRIIRVSRAGSLATKILRWGPNLIPQPASMIRLSALRSVGGYDETLRYAMDLDVFLKLQRVGGLVSVPFATAAFRWHADSLTVSSRRASTREAQAVRRRYLSRSARAVAPLWEVPVAGAAALAARTVSRSASRVEAA